MKKKRDVHRPDPFCASQTGEFVEEIGQLAEEVFKITTTFQLCEKNRLLPLHAGI